MGKIGRKETRNIIYWQQSCEMVLDGPYDSKSLHGGEPRETTNTRGKEEAGKEGDGRTFWRDGLQQRIGKEQREKDRSTPRASAKLDAESAQAKARRQRERKVLSARSYLSLSVVAVASGHDQSEVSIPGYQSAPSAYIIVRSLGHCLSTVVNHILFPRLRFRFIYLSEKRIATVLVANARAHTSMYTYIRTRKREIDESVCVGGHTCKIARHVFYSMCARTRRRVQAEKERERESSAPQVGFAS